MYRLIETERLILRSSYMRDETPWNQAINRSLPTLQRWIPWVDLQYTGLGLATESVCALAKFAFKSFNAVRMQVVMQADNDASKRVVEKCGFVLEATLKKYRVDCLSKQPADDCIFVRFDADGLL